MVMLVSGGWSRGGSCEKMYEEVKRTKTISAMARPQQTGWACKNKAIQDKTSSDNVRLSLGPIDRWLTSLMLHILVRQLLSIVLLFFLGYQWGLCASNLSWARANMIGVKSWHQGPVLLGRPLQSVIYQPTALDQTLILAAVSGGQRSHISCSCTWECFSTHINGPWFHVKVIYWEELLGNLSGKWKSGTSVQHPAKTHGGILAHSHGELKRSISHLNCGCGESQARELEYLYFHTPSVVGYELLLEELNSQAVLGLCVPLTWGRAVYHGRGTDVGCWKWKSTRMRGYVRRASLLQRSQPVQLNLSRS